MSMTEVNENINAMTKALTKSSKQGYIALARIRDAKKNGSNHDWKSV